MLYTVFFVERLMIYFIIKKEGGRFKKQGFLSYSVDFANDKALFDALLIDPTINFYIINTLFCLT